MGATATMQQGGGPLGRGGDADRSDAAPPPGDVGNALAKVLAARWSRYREQRTLLLAHVSTPAVHDLRVALRRLMTVLDMLHRLGVPGKPGALRRRLKRHFKALSRLRDVQVERAWVAGADCAALGEFGDHLQTTEAHLKARARGQIAQGAAATDTPMAVRMGRVQAGLLRYLSRADGERRLTRRMLGEMERLARRTRRRLRHVRAGRPRTVHRLRLAFKAYRYYLEVVAELFPGAGLAALMPEAKAWQARMGEIQDARVLALALAAYGQARHGCSGGLRKAGRCIKVERRAALEDFCGRLEALGEFLEGSRLAAYATLRRP